MKNRYQLFLSALLIGCSFVACGQAAFPKASISNGIIQATFYLPDTEKGYYRGTRFDWSGVMPSLQYDGHTYCDLWYSNYTPQTNDALTGPVESFSPLGFDSTRTEGRFVQIGVGVLSKNGQRNYTPFTYYPIVNAGEWTVSTSRRSITFTHELHDTGYSYLYTKTETLEKNKPVLQITHRLQNNGRKRIEGDVYNHNLFVLDKEPTDAGAVISFPFTLEPVAEGQRNFGEQKPGLITDKQIGFTRGLEKKESVYTVLRGFGNSAADYDIRIENHHTGAAMRITCDRPLSNLVFWGSSTVFSPEPYIKLSVAPGETFTWTISYEFYTCAITDTHTR